MFLFHAVLVLWRVTWRLGDIYWLFTLPYIALLAEAVIVLLFRRAKEWKWFSFCVLFYLLCVVPPIWILEIDKMRRSLQPEVTRNETSSEEKQISAGNFLSITDDQWVWILEQTMLVVIIIGRWLLPKGDLSREQLSSLLLNYVATASDIVDFLNVLSEDQILLENGVFVYSVLATWTLSLTQFAFVNTVQKEDSEDDSGDLDDDREKTSEKISCLEKLRKKLLLILQTEAWVVCLTVLLQDLPFLIVRLVAAVKYNVFTESNYFFIFKNILVLILQSYRLYAIHVEYNEKVKKRKEHNDKIVINLYKYAFLVGKIKRRFTRKTSDIGTDANDTDLGVDYSHAKSLKESNFKF